MHGEVRDRHGHPVLDAGPARVDDGRPPKTWGKITGIVTGPAGPLPGAVVRITTSGAHYTVITDASGHYRLWVDARNPLQVICADDGDQSQMATVGIRRGATTTLNFTLQKV
ncbi:carboxypeptidase-like regulatory domain-containing protein [Streptomyces sp. NPDC050743]|uniref:carboxypeptidase-like regulatory domain-containing protein n=1 Tax=Streptomyces sp. NPDC050743 TaxID=3365634 RepID=UPI0037BAA8EC